ncbi:MAG: hypothetical protein KKF48_00405 [Nanoarchaeota archaeon]|nr:hypothetical protein [Nanoarchaeota archaeon]MBU1027486.1 hypothetical protein [Nanoarchaeota archaeon]
MVTKEKCIVLFSGGLDSRLAIKIMQEKGYEVLPVFFNLPFGTGCCSEACSFNFAQLHNLKLKIIDCSKGKLLQEYLNIVKQAKHGTGAGINPCIDCRIFMLKKTKQFADKNKIKFIATGEVTGQRPMSQQKKQIELIEKETGLGNRIIRPLIDFGIKGRSRKKQIELAKKFKIKYPHPAGGCLLCEKQLKDRLNYLLSRGMNEKEIKLVNVGRHFVINKCWVVIGRNQTENKIIENLGVGKLIELDYPAPSAIILDNNKTMDKKVKDLVKAYSKKGSLKERKTFEGLKL